MDHGAAAGGDHHALEPGQAVDGFPLPHPEALLPLLLENEGDVDARLRLDIRVAVVKGEPEQAREVAADRGFARPHGSDQEDVALGEHRAPIIIDRPLGRDARALFRLNRVVYSFKSFFSR